MYAYDTMVYSYGDIMLKNKKQIIKTRANKHPPVYIRQGLVRNVCTCTLSY